MVVWLAITVIGLALATAGVGVLYAKHRRGQVERADVTAASLLIIFAVVLVILSELLARELVGVVFFLWLPVWYIVRRRHA